MRVEAHIEHGTLNRLLHEIAPVRIHMTPPGEGNRWLELDEPSPVQPIIGRGVRLNAVGRFRFDMMGIPLSVRIQRISLVLEPRVVERNGTPLLAFAIDLEEGDLANVPKLFERPMVKRVNRALSPDNTKMVWAFGDTLTQRFLLPSRIEPLDALSVSSSEAEVTVDAKAVHFAFDLALHIERSDELGDVDDEGFDTDWSDPATSAALGRMVAFGADG